MDPRSPADLAPATVVIPTIGRARLLGECLAALAECVPRPAELIVADQSGSADVADVVAGSRLPARILPSRPAGISRALNAALREAGHDTVLITHDDCVVRRDWVGAAAGHPARDPGTLVTGRVLPASADARHVPSTQASEDRKLYRGWRSGHVLYPNNMAVSAAAALDLGGFDPRFTAAAEDNDFCYRWLRAGHSIAYEPDAVVWHQDWREPAELEALYRRYWRAQGEYYAKHLRRGDLRMLRFLAIDAGYGLAGWVDGRRHRRPRWTDPRRGLMPALLKGLAGGWVRS